MTLLDWDILSLRKENHLEVVNKGTIRERKSRPLFITMENWVTQKMSVEATLQIKMLSINSRDIAITAKRKDIKHMNAGPRSSTLTDLKDTIITIISMDTRDMNACLNLSGHQIIKLRYVIMGILMIGIKIQGTVVTIVVSMVMFL